MQLYYEGEFKAEVTVPQWVDRLWTAIATSINRVLTWMDRWASKPSQPATVGGVNPEYESYGRMM